MAGNRFVLLEDPNGNRYARLLGTSRAFVSHRKLNGTPDKWKELKVPWPVLIKNITGSVSIELNSPPPSDFGVTL